MNLIQKIKVSRRLEFILSVLVRAGFSFVVHETALRIHLPLRKRLFRTRKKQSDQELARGLRESIESLGPVFVKFGQILSTRSDLLPKEYITELEKLQSRVPPFTYAEAEKAILRDFGKPINVVFREFEKKPFASASLGQVYRARLKSGEKVAVKIQRPGAKKQIKLDTQVLLTLAHLIEKYIPDARGYNIIGVVQEFEKWTLNELDYRKEAINCEIFSNFFKNDPYIYGPKVYWDYCKESVLTLEYVDGVSLKQVINARSNEKIDRSRIAHRIADSFVRQCFDYGYFHADPHPGNIFIVRRHYVTFLDFGMVGFLDQRLAGLGASVLLALMQRDVESLVTLLLRLEEDYDEKAGSGDLKHVIKVNVLRKEFNQLVLQWPVTGNQPGAFTKLFYDLLNIAVRNGVGVPTELTMLSKAIVTLDIVIRELDPGFRMETLEKSLLERIMEKKIGPDRIRSDAQATGLVLEDVLAKLPQSTANVISRMERGGFGMELNSSQLLEYERLLNANSRASTYGTLIASILIASALLYSVKDQPVLIGGVTLAQAGLYTGLALIAIFLISNFINKGKQV